MFVVFFDKLTFCYEVRNLFKPQTYDMAVIYLQLLVLREFETLKLRIDFVRNNSLAVVALVTTGPNTAPLLCGKAVSHSQASVHGARSTSQQFLVSVLFETLSRLDVCSKLGGSSVCRAPTASTRSARACFAFRDTVKSTWRHRSRIECVAVERERKSTRLCNDFALFVPGHGHYWSASPQRHMGLRVNKTKRNWGKAEVRGRWTDTVVAVGTQPMSSFLCDNCVETV